MKITLWLATRERATYVSAAETLALAFLLVFGGGWLQAVIGLPILAHLGYTAATALPMGEVPGRPAGAKQRRNQELRTQVASFLREVRRVEEYAQRARLGGHPPKQVKEALRIAEHRMMAAATGVVRAVGRSTVPEDGSDAASDSTKNVKVFAPLRQAAPGS